MFTGLIERTGQLVSTARRGTGACWTIRHEAWPGDPLVTGESVAVQGACLTVTECSRADVFTCDLLEETLAATNLAGKRPGAVLNLERATRQGDRLGGHIVAGHVDGIGTVVSIRAAGNDYVLRIGCDTALATGIVPKGSIAVDGVSLTVSGLDDTWFETHIIPHTWRHTSLRELRRDATLNLETDLIGKYVARYLQRTAARPGLTLQDLARCGFE